MKHLLTLSTALVWQLAALADPLPPHLTGSWSTSAAPARELEAHNDIYLEADGLGVAVGSGKASQLAGGADAGKTARVVLGFPVRVTRDGDTLTLHPFLPPGVPASQAARLESAVIVCRYEAAGPTLTCTGPDGQPGLMRRHSESVPEEMAGMLAAIRAQAPAR